jgi:long-chain acyl-CoA synthetase
MKGYYKNPEATAEAIDKDGWFHTGDIGTMVDGKFLKITDRKKELFKTSAGKYISPVSIENRLKESKYVEQCMVVGDGQKYASAVIVPIDESEATKKAINDHIKRINASLAPYEQLRRHRFVEGPWTVEGGEITPKLSLKRKIIAARYEGVIREIFGAE